MQGLAVLLALSLAGAGSVETETETMIDENDLYVLSHIISAEAGNCSEEMMTAVGSVVLNRVADDRFPDDIESVVFQSGQYSPTWNGTYYNEPTEDAVEIAKMLLEEGSQIPVDVVWQSNSQQGVELWKAIDPPHGIGSRMYFCK